MQNALKQAYKAANRISEGTLSKRQKRKEIAKWVIAMKAVLHANGNEEVGHAGLRPRVFERGTSDLFV